jgi:hypothetical protein
MDLQFRFRESVLRHEVTEADIRHAFENHHVIRQFLNRENVYLFVGFDTRANPIEILFANLLAMNLGTMVFTFPF